jgi:hypothetical protein
LIGVPPSSPVELSTRPPGDREGEHASTTGACGTALYTKAGIADLIGNAHTTLDRTKE